MASFVLALHAARCKGWKEHEPSVDWYGILFDAPSLFTEGYHRRSSIRSGDEHIIEQVIQEIREVLEVTKEESE
jgi:hypothetical protein